ncbi:Uncharacterised protein [Mycobacteroides abscessus subsp. abscessus]|nr:Uncharacterised protein [Mycobacteroides abscessus subsp. abscessus]
MASPVIIGVVTPYGWIELTRMPYSASSIVNDLVRPVRPNFEAT